MTPLQLTLAESRKSIWINPAYIVYFRRDSWPPHTTLVALAGVDGPASRNVMESPEDIAAMLDGKAIVRRTAVNGVDVAYEKSALMPTPNYREENRRLREVNAELLAALALLVKACEREDWDEPDVDLIRARSAIAKAEGREP